MAEFIIVIKGYALYGRQRGATWEEACAKARELGGIVKRARVLAKVTGTLRYVPVELISGGFIVMPVLIGQNHALFTDVHGNRDGSMHIATHRGAYSVGPHVLRQALDELGLQHLKVAVCPCFPKQVQRRYPDLKVLGNNHTGPVGADVEDDHVTVHAH